jgi:hypothetical protein
MRNTNKTKIRNDNDKDNASPQIPACARSDTDLLPPRHPIPPAFVVGEGRPTKYDASMPQKISDLIRSGLNFKQVCATLDIGVETLRDWRREKPELCTAIYRAQAQAVADRLALINTAAVTSWQAAAWWLERKYPQDWGCPKNLTLEVKDFHLREDEAAAHEYQRTLLEQKLRYALNLPPDASDQEVEYAFETKQINVGRARLWGIPEDQLPE